MNSTTLLPLSSCGEDEEGRGGEGRGGREKRGGKRRKGRGEEGAGQCVRLHSMVCVCVLAHMLVYVYSLIPSSFPVSVSTVSLGLFPGHPPLIIAGGWPENEATSVSGASHETLTANKFLQRPSLTTFKTGGAVSSRLLPHSITVVTNFNPI